MLVDDSFDAADDWIAEEAERLGARCVVITGDILLAERCLKAGARVLKHDGHEFDAASIGSAIATRALMADLRAGMDGVGGGPCAVREGGSLAVLASAGPGAGGDGREEPPHTRSP